MALSNMRLRHAEAAAIRAVNDPKNIDKIIKARRINRIRKSLRLAKESGTEWDVAKQMLIRIWHGKRP